MPVTELKVKRVLAGLSKSELATKADIDTWTLSWIELGWRRATVAESKRLEEALGTVLESTDLK